MIPKPRVASIEILHDQECGRFDTDPIEAGIALVNKVAGGLQVLRRTKLIKLSDHKRPYIEIDNIPWPNFKADLNIVVTNRSLLSNLDPAYEKAARDKKLVTPEQKLKFAASYSNIIGMSFLNGESSRVAIIGVGQKDPVELTTAHELGHLLRLKEKGETLLPGTEHCQDKKCVMYAIPGYQSSLNALLGGGHETDFCDECAEQLDEVAFYRSQKNRGLHIPDGLI